MSLFIRGVVRQEKEESDTSGANRGESNCDDCQQAPVFMPCVSTSVSQLHRLPYLGTRQAARRLITKHQTGSEWRTSASCPPQGFVRGKKRHENSGKQRREAADGGICCNSLPNRIVRIKAIIQSRGHSIP